MVVTGHNPRLALSGIGAGCFNKENGIIRPISVEARTGKSRTYELIDGHRRLAACQHLLATEDEVRFQLCWPLVWKLKPMCWCRMLTANDSVLFETDWRAHDVPADAN